jgi:hypothetical protein
LIRVVQIHPDKLLGILGDHDGFPIEKLAFTCNRHFVGSMTHDNFIRIWDARILQDNDMDSLASSHSGAMQVDATAMAIAQSHKNNEGNEEDKGDDSWDDMDEESDNDLEDADDDDSDVSDDSEAGDKKKKTASKGDRLKKRFKTENEKFFEDL